MKSTGPAISRGHSVVGSDIEGPSRDSSLAVGLAPDGREISRPFDLGTLALAQGRPFDSGMLALAQGRPGLDRTARLIPER
jgi:hypothetical protein